MTQRSLGYFRPGAEPGSEHIVADKPDLFEGKRILDLGCGPRHVRERLEDVARAYVGIDVDRIKQPSVVATDRALPFAPRSFDVITAFSHLPLDLHSLRSGRAGAWSEYLVPGGVFIASRRAGHHERGWLWELAVRSGYKVKEEMKYNYVLTTGTIAYGYTLRYLIGTPRSPRAPVRNMFPRLGFS